MYIIPKSPSSSSSFVSRNRIWEWENICLAITQLTSPGQFTLWTRCKIPSEMTPLYPIVRPMTPRHTWRLIQQLAWHCAGWLAGGTIMSTAIHHRKTTLLGGRWIQFRNVLLLLLHLSTTTLDQVDGFWFPIFHCNSQSHNHGAHQWEVWAEDYGFSLYWSVWILSLSPGRLSWHWPILSVCGTRNVLRNFRTAATELWDLIRKTDFNRELEEVQHCEMFQCLFKSPCSGRLF